MLYHTVQRQNPQDRSAPAMWYPAITRTGEVSLRKLAEDISETSTLSTIDVLAVIESLLKKLPNYLENGHSIRLGDFGVIKAAIRTTGSENESDVSSANIEAVRILLLASPELKKQLSGMKFRKVSSKSTATTEEKKQPEMAEEV